MVILDDMGAFAQIAVWDFESNPVWISEKFYCIQGQNEGFLLSEEEQRIVRNFMDFLNSVDFEKRAWEMKMRGGRKKSECVWRPVGLSSDFEVFYAPPGSNLQAIVDEL